MRLKSSVLALVAIISCAVTANAQTQEEINYVTKIMKKPQTKTSTLAWLGGFYFGARDFRKAMEKYSKMAQLYAEDPALGKRSAKYGWALTRMAMCESELLHHEKANALCKSALEATAGQTPENNPYDGPYLSQIRKNCIEIMGPGKTKSLLSSLGTAAVEKLPSLPDKSSLLNTGLVSFESSKWSEYESAGKKSLSEGDLPGAEKYFLLAANEASRQGRYIEPACKSLMNLAQAFAEAKNYVKANETYDQLIKAMEPLVGPLSEKLIPVLAEKAEVQKRAGDAAGAEATRKHMDDIIAHAKLSAQGKGHWAGLLQRSMEAYKARQFDVAEDYARRASEAAGTCGINDQALCLNSYAIVLFSKGSLNQAETVYNSLILLYNSTPDHSVFEEATTYLGLVDVYVEQKRLVDAEKTLAIAERLLALDKPQNHLQEANHQQSLARIYMSKSDIAKLQGKMDESTKFRELGRQALQKSL